MHTHVPCYSAIAIVCTKCERTRQIDTSNLLIRNDLTAYIVGQAGIHIADVQ